MKKMACAIGPLRGRLFVWLIAVAWSSMLAGCGDPDTLDAVGTMTFYPVKGKVFLPDGKPLPPTKVIFVGPVTATLTTESDGTFTVKGTKDGLPAGDYKVRLEVAESTSAGKKSGPPFPSHYLDEDSSGLTATVKPDGSNDFQFDLKKGNAAAAAGSAGSPRSRR